MPLLPNNILQRRSGLPCRLHRRCEPSRYVRQNWVTHGSVDLRQIRKYKDQLLRGANLTHALRGHRP